ncbi:MAG: histidine kinase dimerization/phosphoacceptor domain -containing protein [bacterium]
MLHHLRLRFLTKKETRIEVILNTKLIRYGGKNAVLGILTDITEIKQMENKLRKSLAEKEILLKEIHHRVKNNLQIIHSLLSLQAKYLNDEQDKSLFRQTQDRIKTMALIHEKLYTSQDMVNIDFREYIQNLSAHLLRSYGTASRIELRIEVEKIMLDIDRAVPCSLIINELITNSIKHAFSNGKKSCITIDFYTNKKEYVLSVADNGKGLPDNFDYRNTKSLGLQLVCALTEQLHGNINLGKNKGTKFTITFRKK